MSQRVLIVEDDSSLREIYGERLKAEGFEILSAGDGEEALAIAVKEKPDAIVCDLMMPKISGFDVLDILHSHSDTKDLKIIVMSALGQETDKERAKNLGADRYLVKSEVTLEDLVSTTKEVIANPKTGAEAATIQVTDNQAAAPAAVAPPQEPTTSPEPSPEAPSPVEPENIPAPKPPEQTPPVEQPTPESEKKADNPESNPNKSDDDGEDIYEGISNPNMTI